MTPEPNDSEAGEEPAPTREIDRGAEAHEYVGKTIAGRYEVESRLGEGAMGAVYLAEHVRIGRYDAIKVLNPDMADDEDAWARFTREARNASQINHPNVCTVYDFGETDEGLPFIAMEYVEGETLTRLMEREGPLPPARVAELFEEIADALEAAHSRGIVHRDLKPENIMLDRDEYGTRTVKVVDFGIAKAMQDKEGRQDVTREGFVVGTPQYVSPEQVAGGDLDRRSDLYSLGVVLYEMLTGRLPFTGDSWRAVMTKRLSEDPVPLREAAPELGLGPELERVVHRALAREPEDRYESAGAMHRDLLGAVDPGRAGADGVPATERIGPSGRESGAESLLGSIPLPASWRTVLYGVALAAGLVGVGYVGVQVVGTGAPTPGGPGSGEEQAEQVAAGAGNGETSAPAEGAAAAGAGGAATTGGEADGTGGDGGGTSGAGGGADGGGDGPSADGTEPSTAGEETAPSGEEAPPSGGEAAPSGGAAAGGGGTPSALAGLSATQVDSLLFRQQEVFSPLNDPEPASVRAAGDTASLVWEMEEQPDGNRAFAAYIQAEFLLERGDTSRARDWLERAVELDPDAQGYRSLLESLPEAPR